MIIVKINPQGIKSISLADCADADQLLRERLFLDAITTNLMKLEEEIQQTKIEPVKE